MSPKCEVLLLYSMHTLWQIWRFRSFETQPFRMPKILPQGFIRILSKWFQGNPSLLNMLFFFLNVGRFGRHGVFGRRASLCSLDSAHPGGKNILIKWFATQSLNLYTGKQKDLKGTLFTLPTWNPCPTRHERVTGPVLKSSRGATVSVPFCGSLHGIQVPWKSIELRTYIHVTCKESL